MPLTLPPGKKPAESVLTAIVEHYGDFIRGTIARLCPRNLGIQFDDVEQDARLRLWRALREEREIRDLASYLHSIVATATIDAIRRVGTRREEPLSDGLVCRPCQRAFERREFCRLVRDAVGRLPQPRCCAVTLHLRGMTSREIAGRLGWSEPKARNLVYRGLQQLRDDWQPWPLELLFGK